MSIINIINFCGISQVFIFFSVVIFVLFFLGDPIASIILIIFNFYTPIIFLFLSFLFPESGVSNKAQNKKFIMLGSSLFLISILSVFINVLIFPCWAALFYLSLILIKFSFKKFIPSFLSFNFLFGNFLFWSNFLVLILSIVQWTVFYSFSEVYIQGYSSEFSPVLFNGEIFYSFYPAYAQYYENCDVICIDFNDVNKIFEVFKVLSLAKQEFFLAWTLPAMSALFIFSKTIPINLYLILLIK